MNTPKLRKTIAAAAAVAILPMTAFAFDYNNVEGGFVHLHNDSGSDNGFRIGGSFAIAPPVAVFGEYDHGGDVDRISAGGLFHTPIHSNLDLNLGASLEHGSLPHDHDTGFGLRAGLRWNAVPGELELDPELRYVSLFNRDDVSARLGGLYHINRNLDLQAALQAGDEDRAEVGLRYNFGSR